MDTENTETNTRKNGNGNLRPPWPKGKCPNPKGRPRGSVSIVHLIRRVLKEPCDVKGANGRTWAEVLGRSLIANAIKGNGTAIKQLLDRLEGPVPTVHEGGDKDKPIRVSNADIDRLINNPEAVEAADRLLDLLGRGKADPGGSGMDREPTEV